MTDNVSGVYKIYCKTTKKVYIGASQNMHTRFRSHITTLNKGTHGNKGLQQDWIKYGQGDFEFSVIEETAPDDLHEIEAKHISECNDPTYNMVSGQGPTRLASIQLDEDMRQKIADIARWMGLPEKRHATAVFKRLIIAAHSRESARREFVAFDHAQATEPDPLA